MVAVPPAFLDLPGLRPGSALGMRNEPQSGVVRCDQPRAVDLGAHQARRVERVPDDVVSEILARLQTPFV